MRTTGRGSLLAAAAALVTLTVTGVGSVQAAGTYHIEAGGYPNWRGTGQTYGGFDSRGSATELAFAASGCNLTAVGDLQGKDAYVLDARPYAGTWITTDWTAAVDAGGRSYVSYYGQYCNFTNAQRLEPWKGATTGYFFVPAWAQWMVFTTELKADITFTIR